jgi:hypothetical protein
MVGNFLEADFERFTAGQETVIGTAIAEDFKALANMTPEQLSAHLGHEAGDALLMFLGGSALQAGGRAAAKAMDTVINIGKELKATHTLRSPLLFQFEEAKLYNGFPVDAVKVQKPIVAYARGNSVSDAFKIEKLAQNTEQSLLHQYNRNIDLTIISPSAVAIQMGWEELSPRQAKFLEQLSAPGKVITIKKNDINAVDFANYIAPSPKLRGK